MEEHFLKDFVEDLERGVDAESQEGQPRVVFNPEGDCLSFQATIDEAIVADRIDEFLTIYNSAVDNRPIGFQVKGIAAMIRKFAWEGLEVTAEVQDGEVHKISIVALLLAAYDQGPRNIRRRQGYTAAMTPAAKAPEIDLPIAAMAN